jgi:hypothetical protein
MSIASLSHSLFHSAAAVLTTPTAQLSGFNVAGADPDRMARAAAPLSRPLHDRTQSALLQLQQLDAQAPTPAGALAGDLGATVNGAG